LCLEVVRKVLGGCAESAWRVVSMVVEVMLKVEEIAAVYGTC